VDITSHSIVGETVLLNNKSYKLLGNVITNWKYQWRLSIRG
jgi:hypothetical protein